MSHKDQSRKVERKVTLDFMTFDFKTYSSWTEENF